MPDVFLKRGNSDTDTHTIRTPREDEGRDGGDAGEAKDIKDSQQIARSQKRALGHILLHSPQKESTLVTPWFAVTQYISVG